MDVVSRYLKNHTQALVKEVGIEAACRIAGKSKATLGRYYSDTPEHFERFMPVDTVALLEAACSYPHVTAALAELRDMTISPVAASPRHNGGVNSNIVTLSHRFANLMSEYSKSIQDGVITINEAKRMLQETLNLQKVLIEMKIRLEEESGDS